MILASLNGIDHCSSEDIGMISEPQNSNLAIDIREF